MCLFVGCQWAFIGKESAALDKIPSPSSSFQMLALGVAQTIAWASSTYLPAVISLPVAASLGISSATVFAAYSCGLLVMAALGPFVGRIVDRHGGRVALCWSNGVLIAGLLLLAHSSGIWTLFVAWGVMGAGMALGLYDAAFAALVRQHGIHARRPITAITLLAGFASTIGWPLTSAVVLAWDWQTACLMWASVHLLLALPLNWLSLPPVKHRDKPADILSVLPLVGDASANRRVFLLLVIFGAVTAFVTSAMAAHLPGLLQALGVAAGAAITASALVGPAQVLARLI
jgi:MFS family permease